MYSPTAIVLSIIIACVFCENCTVIPSINVTVYETIDSEADSLDVSGVIELKYDAFHLLIANQSVPELCQNNVRITQELSVLQIIGCGLNNIEPAAFRIVPTLTLLKIGGNPLTTVRSGVFNSIRVKEIDLSRNFISVIENEAFDNNTNLEILRLNHNAIKEIHPGWFKGSPNVYKLSIIYNELVEIPANAFNNLAKNRSLKLRLSANRLEEISQDGFAGCTDIEVLWLNGNRLASLPGEIFTNRTIRSLEVNTNRLLCFPEAMYGSGLRRLQFLENPHFNCTCLRKVKEYVDTNNVDIMYPSIICEDREKEVNLVFNFNKTYEIPLLLPSGG